MFYSTIFFAASALSGLAAAQTSIDPNSVSSTDRSNWCRAEYNTCNTLCGDSITTNNCSTTSLDYGCVCANGVTPNVSEYEQTIPYYVCVEWKSQCNSDNVGNASAQSSCQAVACASETASNVASSSSSSAAASTSSSSGSGSASTTSGAAATGSSSSSASAASSTATGGAAAVGVAREYGAGVLVASLFGLFAYAL